MSESNNDQPKNNRGLADLFSIATLPTLISLAGGLAYWFHLEINAATASVKQEMSQSYETKTAHDTDIIRITDSNQRLWQSQKELTDAQNDIKLNVQKVADAVASKNYQ